MVSVQEPIIEGLAHVHLDKVPVDRLHGLDLARCLAVKAAGEQDELLVGRSERRAAHRRAVPVAGPG